MGLKDTAKCMRALLPFLVRGTWADIKLSTSQHWQKPSATLWRLKALSQHPCSNLCFQTPASQRSTFFLKLDPPSPFQFITFRVLVQPRLWMRTSSFWDIMSLIRYGPFGVLQSSPVWFGVSQGEGQKGVCTDLISESRLKSASYWTTWADFGCCLLSQKELYPTALLLRMFFSLLAKHMSLLWPHHCPKIFNV